MIKHITYIADDGEEFETEEDCLEYEKRFIRIRKILSDANNIEFFSVDGEPITNITIDDDCDFINDTEIMIIKNNNAVDALRVIACTTGFELPIKTGVFYYDDKINYHSQWIRLDNSVLQPLLKIPHSTLEAMLN